MSIQAQVAIVLKEHIASSRRVSGEIWRGACLENSLSQY
jgi:hypothetical protein